MQIRQIILSGILQNHYSTNIFNNYMSTYQLAFILHVYINKHLPLFLTFKISIVQAHEKDKQTQLQLS